MAVVLAACTQRPSEVRGVLVDVQSREIVNADSITVLEGLEEGQQIIVGEAAAKTNQGVNPLQQQMFRRPQGQ